MSDRDSTLTATQATRARPKPSGRIARAVDRVRLSHEDYVRAELRDFAPVMLSDASIEETVCNASESAHRTYLRILRELNATHGIERRAQEVLMQLAATGTSENDQLLRGYLLADLLHIGQRAEREAAKMDKHREATQNRGGEG